MSRLRAVLSRLRVVRRAPASLGCDVEVMLRWGETVLSVVRFREPHSVTFGGSLRCPVTLPGQPGARDGHVRVVFRDSVPVVCVPSGTNWRRAGTQGPTCEAVREEEISLSAGEGIALQLGSDCLLSIQAVHSVARVAAKPFRSVDHTFARLLGALLISVIFFCGLARLPAALGFYVPPSASLEERTDIVSLIALLPVPSEMTRPTPPRQRSSGAPPDPLYRGRDEIRDGSGVLGAFHSSPGDLDHVVFGDGLGGLSGAVHADQSGGGGNALMLHAADASRLPASGVLSSTFVAGGGAAARLDDLLDRHALASGEQVRLSAFEDRERLPYPAPSKDAVALYAELERTRVHESGDRVHLQIALVGNQEEAAARPRVNVRLLLDRSTSMEDGEKWQQAIATAHAIVNKLGARDTFGLVSYAGDATLDFKGASMRDRSAAHAAIDRLFMAGGTNIGAALETVKQDLPKRASPSDIALLILISDGNVTVGENRSHVLASTARELFDASGIITTAIGLGDDFDEQTMLDIAREGGGSYHFVRRAADVEGIVSDELDARLEAIAQALRVRVVLGEGVVVRRVYGSRLLSDGDRAAVRNTEIATDARVAAETGIPSDRKRDSEHGLRMHLPTFRRSDQHVILMELDVPAGSATQVVTVSLDYKDLLRERNGAASVSVEAERTASQSDASSSVRRPVKRTVLAFQAGRVLQDAAHDLRTGFPAPALRHLKEQRELLEAASALWRDAALSRDAALLRRYEEVLRTDWARWGYADRRTFMMAMSYYGDQRMK